MIKILLLNMNYDLEKQIEVITQAYKELYDLPSPLMSDKYIDFKKINDLLIIKKNVL